jgi:uncharacterized protein (TIGR03118 family)
MAHRTVARFVRLGGAISVLAAFAVCVAQPVIANNNSSYKTRVLVSDGSVTADHTDTNLVNPWGVAFNPNGFVWVANNHTGTSTLYDGEGNAQPLIVTIPPAPGSTDPGSPTGIVFNSSDDFAVTQGGASGPSRFIFASESGTIAGWAPTVDPTHAILAVDSTTSKAIYKGLAIAANGTAHYLYATDFHNRKVDVFDATFHPATLDGSFTDSHAPFRFAPFGIQNINGNLFVTYAKQDEDAEDDVAGRGLGLVDIFDPDGHLIRRFAARGRLNAPWGVALAPANFGRFSNMILIGNFGDGAINAFDLKTGGPRGELRGTDRRPLRIDGLWGIAFGNGLRNQPINTLFFAAGPDDETHGVYGRIDPSDPSDDSSEAASRSDR